MSSQKAKENRPPSLNDEDFQPAPKRKKLSLNRFASPLTDEAMLNVAKGPTVANTKKSTDWALRMFCEWRRQRNASQPEKCPSALLESPSAEPLKYWLSRFNVEAWRADGDRYPSSTIYQLLAGLLRYVRSQCKECPNFLDKQDPRFSELRGTCESVSRELRESGVGAVIHYAPVISPEEDKLWNSSAIGIYSPKALVRCVFYYVGRAFVLRGGQEPRKYSNLPQLCNLDYLQLCSPSVALCNFTLPCSMALATAQLTFLFSNLISIFSHNSHKNKLMTR